MPKWNTAVPVLAILLMAPAVLTQSASADGTERRAAAAPAPLKAPGSAYVPKGTISGPDYRVVTSGGYSGYATSQSGYATSQYGAHPGGAVVGSSDTKSIMTCATGRSSPADQYVECNNWVVTDRVVFREDFPITGGTYSQAPAHAPAPVYTQPAPVAYVPAPAPVTYAPAPAPVSYAPAPVRTTSTATLSDSFFSGMSGGVGRDISTGAFYGGGGTIISGSASSSVAARSPVAIVINAKPRRGGGGHRPAPVHPPAPPKGGCGGCGH
jgi:hypothetical protein